jgi:hypothetical protein
MGYYVLFGLGSIVLAAISALCAMFNPLTLVVMNIAAPAVRLFQREPMVNGFSAMGGALEISLLWPLTLAPLHWLNYRMLKWNGWGYGGLILLASILLAFIVLLRHANPLLPPGPPSAN